MSDAPVFFGNLPFKKDTISEIERLWDMKISPQDISRDLDVSIVQIWQTIFGQEAAMEKVVNFHTIRGVSQVVSNSSDRTTGDKNLDMTLALISFLKQASPGFYEDFNKMSEKDQQTLNDILRAFAKKRN